MRVLLGILGLANVVIVRDYKLRPRYRIARRQKRMLSTGKIIIVYGIKGFWGLDILLNNGKLMPEMNGFDTWIPYRVSSRFCEEMSIKESKNVSENIETI